MPGRQTIRPTRRSNIPIETVAQRRIVGELCGQDFNGDAAIEPCVAGFVDVPHATCASQRDDLAEAELRAEGKSHGKWLGL